MDGILEQHRIQYVINKNWDGRGLINFIVLEKLIIEISNILPLKLTLNWEDHEQYPNELTYLKCVWDYEKSIDNMVIGRRLSRMIPKFIQMTMPSGKPINPFKDPNIPQLWDAVGQMLLEQQEQ